MPELRQARTFVVQGDPVGEGCAFKYPDIELPEGESAIEQRDIGIDLTSCVVLVEEGIPADIVEPLFPEPIDSDFEGFSAARTGSETPSSTSYFKWFYNQVYWTDSVGAMVAGQETHNQFKYNGSCTFDGTGWGGMSGYGPSGWFAVQSPTYWQGQHCSQFTNSTSDGIVRNEAFCGSTTVTIWFDYVRANGYYHGGTSGSHYSYRSDSCYALWKNNRLVVVESRPV